MPALSIRSRRRLATPARMVLAGLLVAASAVPAAAQNIVVMTPTTVNQALAAVRPGDTLRLVGTFNSGLFIRNRDFGNVRLDATQAELRGGIRLQNVRNLSVNGGSYGHAGLTNRFMNVVFVENSQHVSFSNMQVIGNPAVPSTGIRVHGSSFVTVRDNILTGHADGVVIRTTTSSQVSRNVMDRVTGDGMKLVDVSRMLVSSNSCQNFTPSAFSHPDCIQMLSARGQLPNRDIFIVNNSAVGVMQGLVSFNGDLVTGTRLTFAGNYIVTSFVHGITCNGCTDSLFADNVLSNTVDSRWAAPIVRTPWGQNNNFSGNLSYDIRPYRLTDPGYLPPRLFSSLLPSFITGSQWDNGGGGELQQMASSMMFSAAANPEPESWAMLMLGFGLVGGMARLRRGRSRAVVAA